LTLSAYFCQIQGLLVFVEALQFQHHSTVVSSALVVLGITARTEQSAAIYTAMATVT